MGVGLGEAAGACANAGAAEARSRANAARLDSDHSDKTSNGAGDAFVRAAGAAGAVGR